MNCRRFKGEIENYLAKEKTIFESRIDHVFRMLNVKTKLNQVKIRKKEGYHAAHLLFILTLLPLMKISTIHSFYKKKWDQWSEARKDSFYRFKQTPSRWRSFMYQLLLAISEKLDFDKYPFKERYFIVDDSTLPKRGRAAVFWVILSSPSGCLPAETSIPLILLIDLEKPAIPAALRRRSGTLEVLVAE
jgi:hypothetical protein